MVYVLAYVSSNTGSVSNFKKPLRDESSGEESRRRSTNGELWSRRALKNFITDLGLHHHQQQQQQQQQKRYSKCFGFVLPMFQAASKGRLGFHLTREFAKKHNIFLENNVTYMYIYIFIYIYIYAVIT